MKTAVVWQRVEGLVIFIVGLLLWWQWNVGMPWWAAFLIFFAPDLSFIGYVLGPKVGAVCYNTVHVYAFGAIFVAIGIFLSLPFYASIGALWLAHCGFDRMFWLWAEAPGGLFLHTSGPDWEGCLRRREVKLVKRSLVEVSESHLARRPAVDGYPCGVVRTTCCPDARSAQEATGRVALPSGGSASLCHPDNKLSGPPKVIRRLPHKIDRTTPPSTRNAAPFVAEESGLAI